MDRLSENAQVAASGKCSIKKWAKDWGRGSRILRDDESLLTPLIKSMKNVCKIMIWLCTNVLVVKLFHMQKFFDRVSYEKFDVKYSPLAALTFSFVNQLSKFFINLV